MVDAANRLLDPVRQRMEGVLRDLEIGYIESFRFIMSPVLPDVRRPRRRKTWGEPYAPHGYWKEVRPAAPRWTTKRSTSARKRKAIRHSLARSVLAGYLIFIHAEPRL